MALSMLATSIRRFKYRSERERERERESERGAGEGGGKGGERKRKKAEARYRRLVNAPYIAVMVTLSRNYICNALVAYLHVSANDIF